MLNLSQFLYKPIYDSDDRIIGKIHDFVINSLDTFPRIVAVSFIGNDDLCTAADNASSLISWTDYVAFVEMNDAGEFGEIPTPETGESNPGIYLNCEVSELRFTELGENELLLMRDVLGKQVFDVKDKKLARVGDVKLLLSDNELRLMAVDLGLRGQLQFMDSFKAGCTRAWMTVSGQPIREELATWNYCEIPSYDRSKIMMSVSRNRMLSLKPAELARTLEELEPYKRAYIFEMLDAEPTKKSDDTINPHEVKDSGKDETVLNAVVEQANYSVSAKSPYQASSTEEDAQNDIDVYDIGVDEVEELQPNPVPALQLGKLSPEIMSDILSDLEYSKAKTLLALMGVDESKAVRILMEYRR